MKLHEVIYKSQSNFEQVEPSKVQRAFMPTAALAKSVGRELSGKTVLNANSGVEIKMHQISGGKHGMLAFINGLVGYSYEVPGTKGKAPKKKGKK